MKKILFLLFIPCVIFASSQEERFLQRIDSHILIEDYSSALKEAEMAKNKLPNSEKILEKYIYSLALNDNDIEAIGNLKSKLNNKNHNFLENFSWAVLNKGIKSTQYQTRLTSLIGAYLTKDVKAVKVIKEMMRDSNAVIRTVAIQLACSYMDMPLKKEIMRLIEDERIWLVKLDVIKAVGQMNIKEKEKNLTDILASEKASYEEKSYAIDALVKMRDKITAQDIERLSKTSRVGLRQLACELAFYYNIKEAKDVIISLTKDPIPDVRIAALNTISLVYLDEINQKTMENLLIDLINDTNPSVSITASYVAILKDFKLGNSKMKQWIYDENKENQRLAAAAVASCANKCPDLANNVLRSHKDLFVKANIAIGLIGIRQNVKKSSDIIHKILLKEKGLWMIDNRKNPLFNVICPSMIRHVDHIPNYPEAVDSMTRLNLLTMLASIEDNRAQEAIKDFLRENSWGITGFAAATLLKEGDEDSLNIVRSLLDDKDQNVVIQAALVLALMGKDESVLTTLENAYKVADHDMKIHILEALGHIASKKSIPFLIDILDEPYQILRVIVASAIIQCINS